MTDIQTLKTPSEQICDHIREWGTGLFENLARVGGNIGDVTAGPRVKVFDFAEAGGKYQTYKAELLAEASEVLGSSRFGKVRKQLEAGYYWAGDAERALHNLVCNGSKAKFSPGARVTGPNWVPNEDGPAEGHGYRLVFFRIEETNLHVKFLKSNEAEPLGPAGVICEVLENTNPTPAGFKRWIGDWRNHLANPEKVEKPSLNLGRDWYRPIAVWQPSETQLLEWEREFHMLIAEKASSEQGVSVQDSNSGLIIKDDASQWVGLWAEASRSDILLGDLLGAEQNVDEPSGPRSIGDILLGQ